MMRISIIEWLVYLGAVDQTADAISFKIHIGIDRVGAAG